MKVLRKSLLGAAIALVVALGATGSANAAITVETEAPSGPCPAVIVNVHVVAGGCHVVFTSPTVVMLVHTGAAEVLVSNCSVSLEARLAGNGVGWLTEQLFGPPGGGAGACTREPCDEPAPSHANLLWPAIVEDAGAFSSVEATLCLRVAGPGNEGAVGGVCTLHMPILEQAHTYTLIANEAACEALPQVEFIGTLTTQNAGTERIEIINDD